MTSTVSLEIVSPMNKFITQRNNEIAVIKVTDSL